MLSILIPVYNFDVRPLVRDLHQQANACGKEFEIICLDDASQKEYQLLNRELSGLSHVIYEELPENTGRSIIRNLLAAKAKYPYLLFMDCDSQTESQAYISKYLEVCEPEKVIYGGRTYAPEKPSDTDTYFRWFYGSKREVVPYHKRQIHPYRSFMTNNFLIPRSFYESIRMDESLKGYGHEDTLFATELSHRDIRIEHIDNPLRHIGIEKNSVFLEQSINGVRNLHRLILLNKVNPDNRLYSTFRLLRGGIFRKIFLAWFRKRRAGIEKNLLGNHPSLTRFDLFKLGILLQCEEEYRHSKG